MQNKSRYWGIIILLFVSVLLFGCHQQALTEDSDFAEFMQNDSDFFTIARTVMPWDESIPVNTDLVYFHKSMNDGREYAEIRILYSSHSTDKMSDIAEKQAFSFAETHVGKSPYFCVEEESFQIDETVFWCYTFSVSKSNQMSSDYYGYAIGYNEKENSVVYLFFSDEELSYSEPDYLLSKFYP